MERIKCLGRYQKGILILLGAMVIVFTVLYSVANARVGYAYENAILIPHKDQGDTVYSGKIHGKTATFTVSDGNRVEFHYGDKIYGPYVVKEDATAIPENADVKSFMTGIELWCGNEMIFRGGVLDSGVYKILYNENADLEGMPITYVTNDGTIRDENGNIVDPMEPSIITILDLVESPQLTHKGYGVALYGGWFLCIVTAILILFADELFRYQLSFRINNVEDAQPSDWEIIGRYIEWTLLPIMALITFVAGLLYPIA
jgi:hypothetical protein